MPESPEDRRRKANELERKIEEGKRHERERRTQILREERERQERERRAQAARDSAAKALATRRANEAARKAELERLERERKRNK